MEKMTPAEIVAAFMEPKPPIRARGERGPSDGGWWKYQFVCARLQFEPFPNDDKVDSLDSLREVEARLTDEQKVPYAAKIMLAAYCASPTQPVA